MTLLARAPLVDKFLSAAEHQRRRLMVTPIWLQHGRIPINSSTYYVQWAKAILMARLQPCETQTLITDIALDRAYWLESIVQGSTVDF